jgi:hypothetical protein
MQSGEKRKRRTRWKADLQKTKDGSNDAEESTDSSVGNNDAGVTLLSGACTGSGRGVVDVAGLGLAASTHVFALDDVVRTLLGTENVARAGNVFRGLDVESTTVVLEGSQSDTGRVLANGHNVCRLLYLRGEVSVEI